MHRSLTVLQVNDLHGYLEPHPEVFHAAGGACYRRCGGLARIAQIFRQARAERPGAVLALDNGDTFHGTYVAVHSRGEALVPLVNALGFDAMTAHWEFAYGPAHLKALARQLRYPLLAINCYERDGGALVFPPSHVVERAGMRIGIVGIACHIVDKTMPPAYSEGVRFTVGNEELPGHIERLRRDERAELIVVLSHLGFPQDLKLAAEVPGIDLLISGHTHNRLYRPARVGNTVLIQSGCHGSFVGRLDVTVADGRVAAVEHALIATDDDVAEDPAMAELVAQAMSPHRELLRRPVGRLDAPLDRDGVLEATMDNVLLDALAGAAGTELAFSNGWRYGAPLLPGEVTLEQLWNIVPTNPQVSTAALSGAELQAMLEANLESTFSADAYRQMGGYVKRCRGLAAYVKIENPPGHRVQELWVEGQPVKADRLYRAAFLGEQGIPRRFGGEREVLPVRAVDALQRHFERHRPLSARLRGSVVAV